MFIVIHFTILNHHKNRLKAIKKKICNNTNLNKIYNKQIAYCRKEFLEIFKTYRSKKVTKMQFLKVYSDLHIISEKNSRKKITKSQLNLIHTKFNDNKKFLKLALPNIELQYIRYIRYKKIYRFCFNIRT